ncbi:MAG: glycosyltransferase family 4 protein [Actinomycetes bacterium]|nr:glycosyltransferase family 4 protein [Actinomycetes bacterium]
MRVGIVCPYSFDAPGGVQFHIRDFATVLLDQGHEVSVLAPAEDTTELPDFVVPTGGSVAVPYNGSVARLNFGLLASSKVAKWLGEGDFDILHIHEPLVPSLGLLALWQSRLPTVGTFHSSQDRSRAMHVASPAVQPLLERLYARIAVSDAARRTVADHLGGDAFVIPNGVFTDDFRGVEPRAEWAGRRHGAAAPTIAFLGRLDEPRKGLPVFAGAIPSVLDALPDARFLLAGRGEAAEARAAVRGHPTVEFLGGISEADKAALFASVDVYVAPQTGGESFGIVLVEAMAGGALVVASDIPAFRAVIDDGAAGAPFAVGDSADLARVLVAALTDGSGERRAHATRWVEQYDWRTVAGKVLEVYGTVLSAKGIEIPASRPRRLLGWRGGTRWSR